MLTNIDPRNIGSLKLYDNSVYSLSAGRIDIKVKRDNIMIKDADNSTHGYINLVTSILQQIPVGKYFLTTSLKKISRTSLMPGVSGSIMRALSRTWIPTSRRNLITIPLRKC